MQGRIIKGIAGFYYVYDVVESVIYECKAKGIFRKEKIKPLVGDLVEYEILDAEEKTGNIIRILPRKNELIRPAVANIDQALVVFAVKKPDPHFNLLDRFLVMMERQEIPVIICFNKKDIADEPEIESLEKTYEACGYRVIFASAREGENILEIKEALKGKTTTVSIGTTDFNFLHVFLKFLTESSQVFIMSLFFGFSLSTSVNKCTFIQFP